MDRYRLPHACLLCHPIALPFRTFWEARRHVAEDHGDILGERYPEEFLRVLSEDEAPPPPRVEDEPPFLCLHCNAVGRREIRFKPDDIQTHWKNDHCDTEYFKRMGIPIPAVVYGDDYLSERDFLETQERLVEKFSRAVESLRTATDLFTEFGLGFYSDPPEGAEDVR